MLRPVFFNCRSLRGNDLFHLDVEFGGDVWKATLQTSTSIHPKDPQSVLTCSDRMDFIITGWRLASQTSRLSFTVRQITQCLKPRQVAGTDLFLTSLACLIQFQRNHDRMLSSILVFFYCCLWGFYLKHHPGCHRVGTEPVMQRPIKHRSIYIYICIC